jgi:hypothetical protein
VHVYLKIATTKIETFTNVALNTARRNGYQNASVQNVRKGKQIYEVLLQTLSGLQARPSCRRLPTTRPSCAEASAHGLGRTQPVLISAALRVRLECLNLKLFH